jgi:hypothetical protein
MLSSSTSSARLLASAASRFNAAKVTSTAGRYSLDLNNLTGILGLTVNPRCSVSTRRPFGQAGAQRGPHGHGSARLYHLQKVRDFNDALLATAAVIRWFDCSRPSTRDPTSKNADSHAARNGFTYLMTGSLGVTGLYSAKKVHILLKFT